MRSDASPDFDPEKITDPAFRRAHEAAKKARLDGETDKQIKDAQIRASYKIEIKFRNDRKMFGDNAIAWQVYESGKHLHGGGDELVYWCIARKDNGVGCGAPIIGSNIIHGVALCPGCGNQLNAAMITSNFVIRMTLKKLATETAKLWRKLNHSADIYCKYSREDIRYKIMEQKVGADKARQLQGLFIYPLANILKDTANGSSLENRFEAFFKA